ncbi:MAG TPA: proline--tRNA ligase [Candidatus Marinimicrobia bacterium]|jgi:prolyl-tRNA synthetase|nr:proline--tRNA ligase [Candidatus Neomarinimicrobiota bacterium]HBN45600.1 proline--tRNA ligase [Candidatus Neomarinimicrobiota bacterium]HJL75496.1 proline--tRNA ligase [Candidatus Neomarinimicrobiota bacterium]HJM69630.1 proline--tRNA ligase [Candidatus Neomarinimicrobiota bacterium]|tara:strand:- start:3273 stop:4739 length:1467 start_codon:yes stop_codon:yes gene_type:complete
MSKGVTPQSKDFSAWYTDVVLKAGLADYGPVKGTMVIKPYGFVLWDNIKESFDGMIKETGHVNAYFPLFIPKSYLAREAEHVEGFAKECAVVTHTRLKADGEGGIVVDPESRLDEEVIVRPTSETVIWSMYKKWIQSYRDLPLLINQWANVVRWEMRTRLFLRTTEFLWQEGHTAHATAAEAEEETLLILELYRQLAEDYLAIPVLTGLKTDAEKFAGAKKTYCIEAMMGDKRSLQAGTSHNLGQNFAKAFDVTFQTKDNKEDHVYATSWGVSTRLVGAVIMAHGDDKGLRLPPKIAPHQVVVVPIARNENHVKLIKDFIEPISFGLKESHIRVYEDWSDNTPGYKFNDWEMKGAPIRMEVGPRDVENNQVVLVRRDTNEKLTLEKGDLVNQVSSLLDEIQSGLYAQAKAFRDENTHTVKDYNEFKNRISKGGFVRCGWDGDAATEMAVKDETKATIRCIPFDEQTKGLKCIYSGKPAKHEVIYAKAY